MLSRAVYPGDGTGYYLIQFRGPILPQWKSALQATGATVFDYVPQFAYIVKMNDAAAARVAALDFVRWVGLYQPAFRLSTDLDKALTTNQPDVKTHITVRAFAGESDKALLQQLASLGASVQATGQDSGGGAIFQLELPVVAITDVARLSGVAWVEPTVALQYDNAIARSNLAMNKDGVETRLGLYGAGQIVVDGDSGLSTGNIATMHDDFKGHFYKGTWGTGSCGTWADSDGHGTHTAGSVLGSGARSGAVTTTHSYSGTNAGIAPEALLWAWSFCSNSSGLPSASPYDNYFGVMYNDDPRVRTNTNSWSFNTTAGSYIAFSRETDRFIWNHPDMVVAFSAGNNGRDANSDGIIDLGSIGVPASSKNVIAVGASENYRLTGGYNIGGPCYYWGTCWPTYYPASPIYLDGLSNNVAGMAAFSSRGPTLDGRIKPDVVAPGTNIVSARYPGANTGWGVYDAYYMYDGGTSMSTPLVAGGSAIVREFYSVTYGITSPLSALVKATLINGARDLTPGQYGSGTQKDVTRRPDMNQGWGRVDLYTSLVYDLPRALWFHQGVPGLMTAQEYSTTLRLTRNLPLRVTLAWSDYPGLEAANGALVNDLDLTVVVPDGTTYYGNDRLGDGTLNGTIDHTNNVEGIDLTAPTTGDYVIRVRAYNAPQGPQPFALVASGGLADLPISCYAHLDAGTVFSSIDASAVQLAVDAATAGETVKVAGTCGGTLTRATTNQTVYLSKTLTLRGGYTTTNWLTSNPIAFPTTLDAEQNGRVVYSTGSSNISVTLENLTIRRGSIGGNGAGIANFGPTLNLSNTLIHDNATTSIVWWGGGVYVSAGKVTLTGSQIMSNSANLGGGLFVDVGGSAIVSGTQVSNNTATSCGGGLITNSGSVLTITQSAITGNRAVCGGGIANTGALTVINSTLSANQSTGSTTADGGGAIDQWDAGAQTSLRHTTIVSNTAVMTARSGLWLEQGSLTSQNSLVALNNGANNLVVDGGVFTSQGYNFTDSGAGTPFNQATDITNTTPLIGPFQDNGGSTWTHALLPGSPATDRILTGVNGCGTILTTDQRGWPRPEAVGHACDIGAYEAQSGGVNLSITKRVTPLSVRPGQTLTYTLVFSNVGDSLATGVLITDVVPTNYASNWSYSANRPITWTGGVPYTWQAGSLAPGETGLITITGVASPGLQGLAGFGNTATIAGAEAESDTSDNTSSASVTLRYTLTANPVGSGAVTKSPNQTDYAYGEVITLTANPVAGWAFSGWSGDLSGSLNPTPITMTGNKVVTATFVQTNYTVTVNSVGGGSVVKQPDQPTYHYSDVITLTATPNAGWTFSDWSGDLIGIANPVTITIAGNRFITATFTQIDYTLTVNTLGSGNVTKNPNQPTYHYGDVITLTATPNPGWAFSGWGGDLTGSFNPITISINTNQVVTTTFAQNDYTLTVSTVGNGSITKNPNQATYHYGDVITLTAIPAANWAFTHWSGDLIGVLNPVTLTIHGSQTVTATFSTTCLPITAADFFFAPTTPTIGQPVNFTPVLTGGTLPITYTWNFGDGGSTITTTASVQHSYPLTNTRQTYAVALTAANACSSQPAQKSITVQPYGIYLPLVRKGP
jgi:uncharacterized repeat protein (TIGR01451 family)